MHTRIAVWLACPGFMASAIFMPIHAHAGTPLPIAAYYRLAAALQRNVTGEVHDALHTLLSAHRTPLGELRVVLFQFRHHLWDHDPLFALGIYAAGRIGFLHAAEGYDRFMRDRRPRARR